MASLSGVGSGELVTTVKKIKICFARERKLEL